MKRIAFSLTVIIAVAAMVSGATYAVFSDQDSFVGNTISTGTVNIDAKPEAPAQTELEKPINATGLVPGQFTDWYRGTVFNQGTVPVRVYMHVANVSGDACGKTNLEVWTGHASGGGDDERARMIFNDRLADITGPGKRVEITGDPPFDVLQPNWSQVIQQRAQLDESANNNQMGQSCTWNEVFTAESIAPEEENGA